MGRQRERRTHKKGGSLGSPFCFSNLSIQAEPAGRIIIKVQFTSGTKREWNEGGEKQQQRQKKKTFGTET
jgi:hypothetical protein